MSSSAYEGLEVVPHEGLQTSQEGLEVVDQGPPEVVASLDGFTKSASIEPAVQNPRTLCGVRKTTFWFLIAVISICVIAGAVSGGVEVSQKSTERSRAPSTALPVFQSQSTIFSTPPSTSTSTSSPFSSSPSSSSNSTSSASSSSSSSAPSSNPSSATSVPSSGIVALDCPVINGTRDSVPSLQGNSSFLIFCDYDIQTPVPDLKTFKASTLSDCLRACTGYSSAASEICRGVTFHTNLTFSTANQGSNCFLRGGAVTTYLVLMNGLPDTMASAALSTG